MVFGPNVRSFCVLVLASAKELMTLLGIQSSVPGRFVRLASLVVKSVLLNTFKRYKITVDSFMLTLSTWPCLLVLMMPEDA